MNKILKTGLALIAIVTTIFSVSGAINWTPQQAEDICRELMRQHRDLLSPGNPSAFEITRVNFMGEKYKFMVFFKACENDGRVWNCCRLVTLGQDSRGFYIKIHVNRKDSSITILRDTSGPLKTF